jgi:SAM-dependent methyltransferase
VRRVRLSSFDIEVYRPITNERRRLLLRSMRLLNRILRNALALTPARGVIWPPTALATHFGPNDTFYGAGVFADQIGYASANGRDLKPTAVLEIGPGRNPYTGLLWNAVSGATVTLWDVFPNMDLGADAWPRLANELLEDAKAFDRLSPDCKPLAREGLLAIAEGRREADVRYVVGAIAGLDDPNARFDLIYSHSALEHVWNVLRLWADLLTLTKPGGLHVHQIDLSDHGRSENFLEMCEYSELEWWLSQRFTPGALNRWRMSDYVTAVETIGFDICAITPLRRKALPTPRARLAKRFRSLPEEDLLTNAMWLMLHRPKASDRSA